MTREQQHNFLVAYATDRMAEYIVSDYCEQLPEALRIIYNSVTYAKLQDPETGLTSQSPSYIYEVLIDEMKLKSCEQ